MSQRLTRPFLVRIAGLPASALTRLRSAELLGLMEQRQDLGDRSDLARRRLADELYERIGAADPIERRELLALRRDCYNGRPLAKYFGRPLWQQLIQDSSGAREVFELEEQLERSLETIGQVFRDHRSASVEAMLESVSEPGFRRGLSLASPTLAQRLYGRSGAGQIANLSKLSSRRRLRLEISLLRYVSRAAAKLSPYSTLTRVAVGHLVDEELGSPVRWLGESWRERSLVRSRRYLTEQLVEAWQRHSAIRRQLPLTVNPSIEKVNDQLRYLRPPAWRIDGGCLRTRPLQLARTAAGTAATEMLEMVESGRTTVADLVGRFAASFEIDPARAQTLVDKVIDLGLLSLRLPWDDSCDVLEAELLTALRRSGVSQRAAEALEALVADQQEFAGASDPAATLLRIEASLERAWEALAPSNGLGKLELWRPHSNEVFEDVLIEPEQAAGPVVALSAKCAEEALDGLRPWLQLSLLTDPRFDFLHTLTAAVQRSRPGAENIGLLELFAEVQPLWRRFVAHEREVRGAWEEPFNPLDLTVVHELASLRSSLFEQLGKVATGGHGSIPQSVISELAARIPGRYRVPIGPCAQIQPVDKLGEWWVVNQIHEGTGRFSSRYASILEGGDRNRFLEAFRRGSSLAPPREDLWLLDLPWNHGDNLAVHPASARLALATPGGNVISPSQPVHAGYQEVVAPVDLTVQLPADRDHLPNLILSDGRRLMPVHLGGVAPRFLPSWLQFVSLWGPRRAFKPLPAAAWRREGEIEVCDRWTSGRWILRRKRWRVSGERLHERLGRADLEGFLNLHRWLRDVGIPDRVYLIEKTVDGHSERRKPQYLDLSCPLFVELLQRSSLEATVLFEEALPIPDDFPVAYDRQRRAQEIQLDALALEGLVTVD